MITNFINFIFSFFKLKTIDMPVETTPKVETTPEPVQPKYLWDNPVNIRHSVRVICDEEGLTLEQKNSMCATIGGESGWKINIVHPNYVIRNGVKTVSSIDFGVCQINDYYHIGKGKDFPSSNYVLNNPEACVRWMCKLWKAGQRNLWIAYKSGSYKKYL